MGKARGIRILITGGMILVALGMNVPSMSFGERLSPIEGKGKATKSAPSPKETKADVVPFAFGANGMRSTESEGEHTAGQRLPQQRALTMEDQELIETTDASGGTMIHLQGKFQSRLQGTHKSTDPAIEEPLSPARPY